VTETRLKLWVKESDHRFEDRVDLEGWTVMRSRRYCGEECWRTL